MMLRLLFISLFMLFHITSKASSMSDIHLLRKEFNLALEDGKKANILFDELSKLKPAQNTLQFAYLGATEALLAKHSFNPFSKLSYVNSALVKLNKAVALNGTNIEIRYMRFSVEANMPAYLGYSKHINEDKISLLEGLKNTEITKDNCEMHKVFALGILNSIKCNKEEQTLLTSLVAACNHAKQIKN
jgi:hypothetical protein